jgi:hypothetical protein
LSNPVSEGIRPPESVSLGWNEPKLYPCQSELRQSLRYGSTRQPDEACQPQVMHVDLTTSKPAALLGRFNVLTPWTTGAVCRNPHCSQCSKTASEKAPVCYSGYHSPEGERRIWGALPLNTDAVRRAGPPQGSQSTPSRSLARSGFIVRCSVDGRLRFATTPGSLTVSQNCLDRSHTIEAPRTRVRRVAEICVRARGR